MSIYIITGKPRHGKTYFLTTLIPNLLKEAHETGRKLYSNFKINYNLIKKNKKEFFDDSIVGDILNEEDRKNPLKLLYYYRNIDTFNFMNNGTILIDEAQRYFNARKWEMLSDDTEMKLQQHGKEDLDIYATTQHYTRIDKTLRIIVETFFNVEMVFGNPNNKKSWLPRFCRISEWYLEDMERIEALGKDYAIEKGVSSVSSDWFFIRKKFYNLYDTRQIVGESRPMPLKHVLRRCLECGKNDIKHY